MPYLNAMADFRDNVRRAARELKAVEILQECDRLRDDVLPDLGVRLEDKVRAAGVLKMLDGRSGFDHEIDCNEMIMIIIRDPPSAKKTSCITVTLLAASKLTYSILNATSLVA